MNASTGLAPQTAQAPASQTARGRARWAAWLALAIAALKELGPYAAIEIILPGGTLIALALWLYRRRAARLAQSGRGAAGGLRSLIPGYNRSSCATCA